MANPLRVVDGLAVTTGDVVTDSGDVTATAGAIEAGTTVAAGTTLTAGTGITATTGDVLVSTGDISVTLGSVTADEGNITATLGDITASAGAVAGTTISADGTQVLPQEGAYSSAVLHFVSNPADGATIDFGGITYTIEDTPAVPKDIPRSAVNAEGTLDNMLTYINTDVNFDQALVAEKIDAANLRLVGATGAAGSRVKAVGVVAVDLADSSAAQILTNRNNLNEAGKSASGRMTGGQFAVSVDANSEIVAGRYVDIDLPFTPTWFHVSLWAAAGAPLGTTADVTDTFTISGDAIRITGTGGVHLAATDVVRWIAGT